MNSSIVKAPSEPPLCDGMVGPDRSSGQDSNAPPSPRFSLRRVGSFFVDKVTQSAGLLATLRNSRVFRRWQGFYLNQIRRVWNHLPDSIRHRSLGRALGRHLHALVRRRAERKQYFATFFLRNRPELELMRRLADKKAHGSSLKIAVLACSKGAEVYSIAWTVRSARPDLELSVEAVDISQEILDFAETGVYSLARNTNSSASSNQSITDLGGVIWNTDRDQNAWIFERMTPEEMNAMFELEGGRAMVKPWLKEGITWMRGDAADPRLIDALGPQHMVVANCFLCHMDPPAAEKCLRNIARLVKPGGHLFVSGVDLNVRTKVARELRLKPVTDLMREIHDGDPSIRSGWPLEYWGLESFDDDRPDRWIRYASVFQIGDAL